VELLGHIKNVISKDFILSSSLLHIPDVSAPAHAGSSLEDSSTLKMEAILSSETSVNAKSTQRHIPEDDSLQYNS
jgi:hypothetical protein